MVETNQSFNLFYRLESLTSNGKLFTIGQTITLENTIQEFSFMLTGGSTAISIPGSTGTSSYAPKLIMRPGALVLYACGTTTGNTTLTAALNVKYNVQMITKDNTLTIIINGTTICDAISYSGSIISDSPISIFSEDTFNGVFYSYTLFYGTSSKSNLVPVKRISDGKVGLLDAVLKLLYTPDSLTLIAGTILHNDYVRFKTSSETDVLTLTSETETYPIDPGTLYVTSDNKLVYDRYDTSLVKTRVTLGGGELAEPIIITRDYSYGEILPEDSTSKEGQLFFLVIDADTEGWDIRNFKLTGLTTGEAVYDEETGNVTVSTTTDLSPLEIRVNGYLRGTYDGSSDEVIDIDLSNYLTMELGEILSTVTINKSDDISGYRTPGLVVKRNDNKDSLTIDCNIIQAKNEDLGNYDLYLNPNGGTIHIGNSTIGKDIQPIYLKDGVITASTANIGSSIKPIYLKDGVMTASDGNIASSTSLMYLKKGELTESNQTVGAPETAVYLKDGKITASNATIGGINLPVYVTGGTITPITQIDIDHGGTGTSDIPVVGGIAYGKSESAYGFTAAGEPGLILSSTGANTPVWRMLSSLLVADKDYNGTSEVILLPSDFSDINYLGITTTNVTTNTTASIVNIDTRNTQAVDGSVVTYEDIEYVKINGTWTDLKLATNYLLESHVHGNLTNNGKLENANTVVLTNDNTEITSGPTYSKQDSKYILDVDISGSAAKDDIGNVISNTYLARDGGIMEGTIYFNGTSKYIDENNYTGNAKSANKLNITGVDNQVLRFDGTDGNIQGSPISVGDTGEIYLASGAYGFALPDSGVDGLLFFIPDDTVSDDSEEEEVVASISLTDAPVSDVNYYITGATSSTETNLYLASAQASASNNTAGIYFNGQSGVLFGAAWNDYAEYRLSDELEPGRVVCETGYGDLKRSTARLQPGAEVISDTFGFTIGKSNVCLTPIAVSGRVLVYTYEDRESYAAGDAVCAGPNGTVSKMTREEIREYPDRMIGTVSEIPNYKYWGETNVLVNNRIWIRIK